jgi:hypothetical protein
MNCPDIIFERLNSVCDGYSTDKLCLEYAYDCLDGDVIFTGKCLILFPEFSDDLLEDWKKLEYWLSDISLYISLTIEDIWEPTFNYWEDGVPNPRTIFKDDKTLKKLILERLNDPAYDEIKVEMEAGYVEVTNEIGKLYLVFTDYTAWGLGHADQILVIKDLGYLSEDNHFYELDIHG